ncbi:MAG: hypothetical protein JW751_29635 [Polyangiaceae bacterium]|nr:hypothetical protein [Polyangiaceae bacterium]
MITLHGSRCFVAGGALPRSVRTARFAWQRREGLIFELHGSGNILGQGEATPLPGYSRETLEDCRAALAAVRVAGLGLNPGVPFAVWLAATTDVRAALPPAARCAFEGALLDLAGKASDRPAWACLEPAPGERPEPRELAALLYETTPTEIAREARSAIARGIRCLKLKIGRPGSLADELELATAVRREVPDVSLRLDANRAFSLTEAARALEGFAGLGCELVEEPTFELELARLEDPATATVAEALAALPLPVALDESLRDAPPGALRRVRRQGFPLAVVLKPMLLGGVARSLELATEARELDIDVIVTHLFDGPLGLATAATVALAVGTRARAMGLDPHPALPVLSNWQVAALAGARVVTWTEPGLGVGPMLPGVR